MNNFGNIIYNIWPPKQSNNGNGESCVKISVAIIGCLGPIVVAVISGIFLLANTVFDANEPPTSTPSPALIPTQISTDMAGLIVEDPRIYEFSACWDKDCNQINSSRMFPEKTRIVYLQWKYENIPNGSHYVRTWELEGKEKEWVKYDCMWTKTEDGIDRVDLREPKGLHSGNWNLKIYVDEVLRLDEHIFVEGKWDVWEPVQETIRACYGTQP
jgi:hypothetical protein